MKRTPIEHCENLDHTTEDAAIAVMEKAMEAIKPETINSSWSKLSRCTRLHRVYDRANHESIKEIVDMAKKAQ